MVSKILWLPILFVRSSFKLLFHYKLHWQCLSKKGLSVQMNNCKPSPFTALPIPPALIQPEHCIAFIQNVVSIADKTRERRSVYGNHYQNFTINRNCDVLARYIWGFTALPIRLALIQPACYIIYLEFEH